MVENCEREIKSLEGGRKASSARARKSLQNIKSTSHSLRKNIMTHTKALPVKRRTAAAEAAAATATAAAPVPVPAPAPAPEPTPAPKKRGRKKKTT